MFNCSNCGHQIDDARVPLPPFCPRCGEPTSEDSSPFDDDELPSMEAPLPPPPPMGAPLPPPPPMGAPGRPGRGEPSKTLFGMPGLNFDDIPDHLRDPPPPAADNDLPFPVDDDDELEDDELGDDDVLALPANHDDGGLPFPVDDDDDDVPLSPLPKDPPIKPPPMRAPPPVRPPASAAPPPIKPPPIKPPPGRGAAPPPLPPGKRGKPPPIKSPLPPGKAPLPPFPGKSPAPPPIPDAFSSGLRPTESGVMPGDSSTFDDDDPFFTGDPEHMPELGSITHGDASTFASENPAAQSGVHGGIREFEFDDDGDALELGDLGDLNLPKTGEMPAPTGMLDLPGASRPAADDFGGDLDLPAPTARGPRPHGDLDLPMPASDLPMPSSDLPMPSSDLPMPADDFGGGLSLDDGLPMPGDLPMPAGDLPGDDFPAPADDFPTPANLDGFDALPTSADLLPTSLDEFPTPADVLPTPAQNLPRSADVLPRSAEKLELDLDGPAGDPVSQRARAAAVPTPGRPTTTSAQKTPAEPGGNRGRFILYGVLGVAVVVVLGGYLALEMGLLDPTPPPPIEQAGDGGSETPTPSSGEPTERPEGVLAKLDLDTPASYVQALELSEGDNIGRAEAALLLHYRYGPDAARLEQGAKLLAAYQDRTEPFVRRVVGLAKLATGKPAEALGELEGDGPRTALYRAWALLELGKIDEARAAAEAAVAARPNDQAAQLAVLQARFASNPVDGLAAMRQAAQTSPNHLALQEGLMRAARELGRLAEAAEVGLGLQPSSISEAHKAELLRERAGIAIAQGRTGEAMRLLEQAIATDPALLAARVDRVDLWLQNKDFASVRADIELLLREHPKHRLVLVTAARVDLEAGRDEDVRAKLSELGDAAASDPEVQDLLGQAEAMLMKVDEARSAFTAARKLDPMFTPALEHEVELLVRAEMGDEALALLDAQRAALSEAGAASSGPGRRALSAVSRIRADLLRARGELELALTAAEDAIASDPSNNDALLLRALLLGKLGKRKAHEEALLELHERTSGYPGLTEPLGTVLLRKGKLDELERLIGGSLDNPDASREIVLTGAALRLAQDKPEAAEVLAQRVLDRDPTDARAHLLLGRALLAKGDYALALDEIQSAQTREGDAEVELWLGQALEYNGRPGEARVRYKQALELDPQNLEAAALLGRLYAYEGAATKAIELLEPVIAATDDYPYAYLAIGLARRDIGRPDLSIPEFQKAQQLDPSLFEAYYQEGRIHNDRNAHGPAVKALQTGLDKAKANATERALVDTYRRLGESYSELGRRAEAKAALETYLELAPPTAAGRREVERLLREL